MTAIGWTRNVVLTPEIPVCCEANTPSRRPRRLRRTPPGTNADGGASEDCLPASQRPREWDWFSPMYSKVWQPLISPWAGNSSDTVRHGNYAIVGGPRGPRYGRLPAAQSFSWFGGTTQSAILYSRRSLSIHTTLRTVHDMHLARLTFLGAPEL